MNLFLFQTTITFILLFLLVILISINLYKGRSQFEKELFKNNIFSKKKVKYENIYRKFVLFKKSLDSVLIDYFTLMKIRGKETTRYYKECFIFSIFFMIGIAILSSYIFDYIITFIILFLSYILGNLVYIYTIKEKIKKYKAALSSEVVELFLTFHLLYPTYKNPDATLRKIILSNKNLEINRQMEHMLLLVSEQGLDSGVKQMLESIRGITGLDIFIELYYNLKKEGIRALQNINSYIGNIISSNELIAEKKINEAKAKVELVIILVIFLGMVILIISPMFLGKFDGQNSLIDYIGFISGN